MRTIKFRAWDKREKIMYDVFGIAYQNGKIFSVDLSQKNNVNKWTSIEEVELMQFTGLHDNNGKEIYEGDIVHIIEKGDYGGEYYAPVSYLDNWAVFGIVLLHCKEISKSKTNERVDTIWTRGFLTRALGSCVQLHEAIKFELCEVIGNIHEHKHLLDNTDTKV